MGSGGGWGRRKGGAEVQVLGEWGGGDMGVKMVCRKRGKGGPQKKMWTAKGVERNGEQGKD